MPPRKNANLNIAQDSEGDEQKGKPANPGSGKNPGRDLDIVNKQIQDAVKFSTQYAFGTAPDIQLPPSSGTAANTTGPSGTGPRAFNAGTPIAYQKASQAMALSVQDAVDYQRNILSMTSAAEGKALQLMFEDIAEGNIEALGEHAIVYILSMLGALAGGLVAEQITNASGEALAKFPTT